MEAAQVTLLPNNAFRATAVRIIDGDTLLANVELGFGVTISRPCRIRGYDSPELRGPTRTPALKAMDALTAILPPGTQFVMQCPSWSIDRYCRIIGDWYLLDGTLVKTLLPQEYVIQTRP